MKTLADIFEHTLQDIYYAENAMTKALPKVAKAAKSAELKKAAEDHLSETKDQIKKLEQVFKSIGKKASGEKCDAIEGLIKEADGLMEEAEGTAAAGLPWRPVCRRRYWCCVKRWCTRGPIEPGRPPSNMLLMAAGKASQSTRPSSSSRVLPRRRSASALTWVNRHSRSRL